MIVSNFLRTSIASENMRITTYKSALRQPLHGKLTWEKLEQATNNFNLITLIDTRNIKILIETLKKKIRKNNKTLRYISVGIFKIDCIIDVIKLYIDFLILDNFVKLFVLKVEDALKMCENLCLNYTVSVFSSQV